MLKRSIAACVTAMALAFPAAATSVLPLPLEQIIDDATTAFQGTCLENRVERDAATGLVVTYTRFAVQDVLKGDVGATHTIKQVGGELAGDAGPRFKIQGVPKFSPGEQYVVLLAGVSGAGFSSPIGLSQGKFNLHREPGETKVKVTNGRDFREMTADLPMDQLPATLHQKAAGAVHELDLDEFKDLVRQRVGRGR